eukprot:Gb_29312 [translate_table: standard]
MEKDNLPKRSANYTALTPLWFLERAALVHPHRPSIVYGNQIFTWHQTYCRCRRFASALLNHSIGIGSTVSVLAPNIPAHYEANFGVPMAGAVINSINIRLDARTISLQMQHSSSVAIFVDQDFFALAKEALNILANQTASSFKAPLLVVIRDDSCNKKNLMAALDKGAMEYEDFLQSGDPLFQWKEPADEWQSIALCYTSGTTSSPKGVVLNHRGAYIASVSGALAWNMSTDKVVYLWTLPMFHCDGWCYTWALAAFCGTNVCLRQVTARGIFSAIAANKVTHFCAAPVVLNTIINATPEERIPIERGVRVMTAGAAPPATVLARMEEEGFRVTHTYGLTETYGPITVCVWKEEWDSLPLENRARLKARQGVRYVGLERLEVVDMDTMDPVPADGITIGEIVMKGNLVMKGYLKNPEANAECFRGGWFHSGDLAVKHPDGYIEVKDRAKDIIISGGENISSLEVETAIYRHPQVLEVSVVARPDDEWGESPCAFVTLKNFDGKQRLPSAEDIIKFCRSELPRYMIPKSVVFGALPKTATGKIQKHALRARAKALGALPKSRM